VTVGITLPTIAVVQPAFEAALPASIPGTAPAEETIAAVAGDVTLALHVGTAAIADDDGVEPVDLRRAPFRGPSIVPAARGLMPVAGSAVAPPVSRWSPGGQPTLGSIEARGPATGRERTTGRAKSTPSKPSPAPPPPAPTGATVSAAGAAGSSGGGIPIFLALPFVAAMLDLARRVALDRATWPSGHRRRVPERPG